MTRVFIELSPFRNAWARLGLGEKDLLLLQETIVKDPEAGALIQGTGGVRKLRFPLPGKGKRGGCRVCYVDFEQYCKTYLLTAYAKKEQENLTNAEKQTLKSLVKVLSKEAGRRYHDG